MTGLVITKLDVLTGIGPLQVAVRYRHPEGATLRRVPLPPVGPAPRGGRVRGAAGLGRGHHRRPRRWTTCPQAARDYLAYIADFVGVPIKVVGVGPARDQVIWVSERADAALEAA